MIGSSIVRSVLAGLALLACAAAATAQEAYPQRQITLVVPYPPGASTDGVARTAADLLSRELGQRVVVENRPGGDNSIGISYVKRAPADGYTVLLGSSALLTSTYAVKNAPYKVTDFVPVSPLGTVPFVMMVPASLKVGTLAEFVEYARRNQASLNHGTLGSGASIYKVMGENFTSAAGFRWTDVPYKGGADLVTAGLSGQIQAFFVTVGVAISQRQQPNLRMLGLTDTRRSRFLPDLPTFPESGYPNVLERTMFGLYVRVETPEPVRRVLEDGMRKVMASAEMKQRLDALSLEPYDGSAAEFGREMLQRAETFERNAARLNLERN